MSLRGKLRTWRRLSTDQRWTTCRAALEIPWVRLHLSSLGLRRTQHRMGLGPELQDERSVACTASLREQAYAVSLAVGLAARVAPGGQHCLTRSLVLLKALRTRAIPAHLRIGTRLVPVFSAHAWVELADGSALLESASTLEPLCPVEHAL